MTEEKKKCDICGENLWKEDRKVVFDEGEDGMIAAHKDCYEKEGDLSNSKWEI